MIKGQAGTGAVQGGAKATYTAKIFRALMPLRQGILTWRWK